MAATFLPDLLHQGLHERLRARAGAAYAPMATYEPVDDERAVVIAWSDLLPALLPTIADEALGLVRDLATMGPSPEQLRLIKEQRHQVMNDPYAASSIAYQAAHEFLRSRAPLAHQHLVDEMNAVSSKVIKEEARAFADALMLGLPNASAWSGQTARLQQPMVEPQLQGDRHRHRDWPEVSARLVVNDRGVEIADGNVARRVLFEDATAVFGYPGGTRLLVSHDGWSVTVDPTGWHGGTEAVGILDRHTPTHLALSRPAAEAPPAFERRSLLKRWGAWARRVMTPRAGSTLWQTVAPLLVVVGIAIAFTIVGLPGLPPDSARVVIRILWFVCLGVMIRTIRGVRI